MRCRVSRVANRPSLVPGASVTLGRV
jgi:hypothetical protein